MKRDVILSIFLAIVSIGLTIYYVVDSKNDVNKEMGLNSIISEDHSELEMEESANSADESSQQPINDSSNDILSTSTSNNSVNNNQEVQSLPDNNNGTVNSNQEVVYRSISNNRSITVNPSNTSPESSEKSSSQTSAVIEVNSVKLDKTFIGLDIIKNKTANLKISLEPANATDRRITIINSNSKVASIDKNGLITAKANGTTTITVKTPNGKKASCVVKVGKSATQIGMTRLSNTAGIASKLMKDEIGHVSIEVGPGGVDLEEVEWTNSDPDKLAIERIIENGTYYIKSALNENKVFNVAGESNKNNAAIQIYERNNTLVQQFEIINVGNEYYVIRSKASKKVLNIPKTNTKKGVKIQQYDYNGTNAQLWEFEYLGKGYYRIRSGLNGLYLSVTEAKTDNNTPIHMWTENRNKAQLFKLEQISRWIPVVRTGTYYIKSGLNENKVFDVAGGSNKNKAAIQIYEKNNTAAQQFEIINLKNNYYVIRSVKSGKVLDIPNGLTSKNTMIQQYSFKGTEAQIWKIEKDGEYYRFKSRSSGLYLSVVDGKAENKSGVQIYTSNKSKAQKFKLEKISPEIKHANIEQVILKGKKKGTTKIKASLKNGKGMEYEIPVKESYWEIRNGKYIYHYMNGSTREWSKSCYVSWQKIKNVKPLDPTLPKSVESRKKAWTNTSFTYAGVKHDHYYCYDDTANNIAIKNGGSPYAIAVDLGMANLHIYKKNNDVWEPDRTFTVNVGAKGNRAGKIYAKSNTPSGLYYINGNRQPIATKDDPYHYWVAFGVTGHNSNNEDYLHYSTTGPKGDANGITGTERGTNRSPACITLSMERAEWIYYNIGRGTPILIW